MYSPKELVFDQEGRDSLIKGITTISKAVKSTLGPRGKTVLIESNNHTHGITVTKDGVTVAKSIDLLDPVENLAVKMMKEAADKTASSAGDGPQPLDANVLTPQGWVKISDLLVGDIICGTNESTQEVLGIFPKGDLEIHEVVFADGRVVECSDNHLWTVTTNYGVVKTLTTADLMNNFKSGNADGSNTYKYYVKTSAVEFAQNGPMPLDPYLVGLLIGDGSLSGSGAIELSLGKSKEHVLDKIVLPEGITKSVRWCEDKNYFRVKINGASESGLSMFDIVSSIGLLGTKSNTKFIPSVYLYSNIEDRRRLLKGLLDTDGHINSRGLFEFSTVSDKLADDFQELISGLGYAFNRRLHTRDKDSGSYSDKSIHRIVQLVGYKYGAKIVDVRATGITTEMMCIKVSNEDHLYITDNYIPTHNTTTAIVLTEAIVTIGSELITDKHNVTEVIRYMNELKDEVLFDLKKMSRKVKGNTLRDVASISANNDKEIGRIIADAYDKVGNDGIVTVENSQTADTYSEVTDGIKISRGYTSKLFVNDFKKDECIMDDVYVLVSDQEINNILSIESVLKPIINDGKKLLIIAPCTANVINTLAANVVQRGLKFCNIAPPQFGYKQQELMADIALAVGAKYFSEQTGDDLSLITFADLGKADRIIVDRDKSVIVRSNAMSKEISERVEQLWVQHNLSNKKSERDAVKERIASLTGGVGVIYVGGNSDIEQKEKFDRVDDAVCAVRSALEEGILPGGGLALFNIADKISTKTDELFDSLNVNEYVARQIISKAIETPLLQILENAGKDGFDIMINAQKTDNHGYDVKNEVYGDMFKMGIIDPLKVTKNAFENAVSVATTVLSTNAIITMARA